MSQRKVDHQIATIRGGNVVFQMAGPLTIDIQDVGLTAIKELLQAGLNGSVMAWLFEALLKPNESELIWRHDGPGQGVEMKRGVSSLFGRFFARWYLTRHEHFAYFYPINKSPAVVSQWLVILRSGEKYLPDWFCAGNRRIALAEAKGSYDKHVAGPMSARPLIKAREQLESPSVWSRDSGSHSMSMKSVRGWGVMSRWATESNQLTPLLYAVDPTTVGDDPDARSRIMIIKDVASIHFAMLLDGMGLPDLASKIYSAPSGEELSSILVDLNLSLRVPFDSDAFDSGLWNPSVASLRPPESSRLKIEELEDEAFIGVVIDSAGNVIRERVSEMTQAMSALPTDLLRRYYFVGIQQNMLDRTVRQVEQRKRPKPMEFVSRHLDKQQWFGRDSDGFVLAPLANVSESKSLDIG